MPDFPSFRLVLSLGCLGLASASAQSVPEDLLPATEPAPAAPARPAPKPRPPVPSTPAAPGRNPVELAQEAGEAVKAGKWETAIKLYGEWVDNDPLNPLARASYGSALYRTGNFLQSRRELEKAVLIEPKLAGAWATLGLLYDRDGEPWLALSAYTRAVHLEPRTAPHHVALALALAKRSWMDAAESELNAALELDPKSADAHFNLAVLAVRRTPPALETARRHYNEARKLGSDPDGEIESIFHEATKGDDKSPAPKKKPAKEGKKK